jgi:hypothetical protein
VLARASRVCGYGFGGWLFRGWCLLVLASGGRLAGGGSMAVALRWGCALLSGPDCGACRRARGWVAGALWTPMLWA